MVGSVEKTMILTGNTVIGLICIGFRLNLERFDLRVVFKLQNFHMT